MRYAVPATVLAVLVALFAVGLTLDPTKVPSPLIGKPAPAFALPLLADAPVAPAGQSLTLEQLKGSPVVINFWASWCTPCLQEHPLLMDESRKGTRIVGLNYKDEPAAAQQWLARHGDPFAQIGRDTDGRAGLDWGVYGVPETFVLDAQGVIRHKHIGPLTREAWDRDIAPLLESARAG